MTNITQVGTVGVPTTDQERALTFYVDTLGFETRLDAEFAEGMRWIEVAPVGAEASIALLPPSGPTAENDTGVRFTTKNADADHADLKKRGVDVDPEVMRWPGVPPMFSFRDSEGNTLYIVERP